jgi:hypothetical protein
MTSIHYTNGDTGTTTGPRPRRRLTGTAHRGPHWINGARILRLALQGLREHAGWRRTATVDQIGTDIIDRIHELDDRSLHVLQFVFAVLVRASRSDS